MLQAAVMGWVEERLILFSLLFHLRLQNLLLGRIDAYIALHAFSDKANFLAWYLNTCFERVERNNFRNCFCVSCCVARVFGLEIKNYSGNRVASS